MEHRATIWLIAAVALAGALPLHAQTTDAQPADSAPALDEALGSFQLPPQEDKPSAIQGPETADHPIVTQPLPTAPAKSAPPPVVPTAAAAKPTAKPAAKPAATVTEKPAAPTAQPREKPPEAAPGAPAAEQADSPAVNEITASEDAAPAPAPEPAPVVQEPAAPALVPATLTPETGSSLWGYLFVVLLLIPMGVAGYLFWRQNHRKSQRIFVLPIERPQPRTVARREDRANADAEVNPVAEADEDEAAIPASPLRHALETTSLSVTLVNATLSYQLTLTNTSRQMIRDIVITGDLVSAHSSLSMEEQLAGPVAGAALHRIAALLPGQSMFLNGQMRLPISAIRPLRREQAVLFIPLVRMRIEGEGLAGALLQTCVVGQKPSGPGAGLRPFRLDTGPRVYAEIGQRTLEAPIAA